MRNDAYTSLVHQMRAILKKNARGKPPSIRLSRETAALLESVTLPKTMQKPHLEQVLKETVSESPPDDEKAACSVESPCIESAGPDSLDKINAEISSCKKCPLYASRLHTVSGEGNPSASLVFVGEAPGASEDRQGRPFVGRAGQLLTDIISKGMKMSRDDVFICNVLKCRPPENRVPNPEEIMYCEPYLLRQLDLIRPKVICALGAVAAHTLLKNDLTISRLRGEWHTYHGIALRVTYHPAYLLRNPADKVKTWDDVKEILQFLKAQGRPADHEET